MFLTCVNLELGYLTWKMLIFKHFCKIIRKWSGDICAATPFLTTLAPQFCVRHCCMLITYKNNVVTSLNWVWNRQVLIIEHFSQN